MAEPSLPTTVAPRLLPLVNEGNGIQKLLDKSLQAQIDSAVAFIPPDKHAAVVGVYKDGKAAFAAVARLGSDFTVMMAHTIDPKGPDETMAVIKWTPF